MKQGGIDGGKIVIALGAALLFASLFVDWYGLDRRVEADGFSAWTAFELVDLLLALLALAAIAAIIESHALASRRAPEWTAAVAGPAALLLVLVSLVNVPPAAQGLDSDLKVGAWLALAGAAIMCAGALLALNRVSLVVTPRERPPEPRVHETQTQPLPPDPKP